MIHHSSQHTNRYGAPLGEVCSSMAYKNGEKMFVIRVKSQKRQYSYGQGPFSGHNHLKCINRQWEDLNIYIFCSDTVHDEVRTNVG